ncbi:ras-related protein Rab-38 isoform X1 [Coccinella septempunctata]|uniref:ras-related protein Rab-38 isoform X1 n=1 Tax=Coccinella septempunctata TaxID=41139 RepID=UPI001D0762E6|nr:ras-related protein Rab-38 isoform X1 [Coccinella septempunctata]
MNNETGNDTTRSNEKLKSVKANYILKKIKLKVRPGAVTGKVSEVPSTSQLDFSVDKITSEDEENLMLSKSASETKLSESQTVSESEGNKELSTIDKKNLEGVHAFERAKSLEIIKRMPAYGELIADTPTSSANQTQIRRRDHLYKVLVIGDLATGKTSIIKRYVHRFFSQNYRATIGVDFALKVINWDENTVIRLQLWDIAGQERYGNMTRVYFKEAVGAFIVFDCTRMNTFESVKNWKTDLDSKVLLADGSKIPCVLLANKCDQPKEGIVNNSHQMDEYCKTEGFAAWFATSAKDNINIDEAAKVLIERILEKESVLTVNKDGDQFSIQEDNQEQNQGKKKCLC